MITIRQYPTCEIDSIKGEDIKSGTTFKGSIGRVYGTFLRAGSMGCGVIVCIAPNSLGSLPYHWTWNKPDRGPIVTLFREIDVELIVMERKEKDDTNK